MGASWGPPMRERGSAHIEKSQLLPIDWNSTGSPTYERATQLAARASPVRPTRGKRSEVGCWRVDGEEQVVMAIKWERKLTNLKYENLEPLEYFLCLAARLNL